MSQVSKAEAYALEPWENPETRRDCPECGSEHAYEDEAGNFICWCDEAEASDA